MTTVILLRHGRSTANTSGVLAGRTPGVGLDDHGRTQAEKLVDRLAELPLAAVVTSPLQRCEETLAPLLAARGLTATVEPDLAEVDYGDWTGRKLGDLGKEDLWKVVQAHPSAAVFPGGEGLAAMQTRAVAAIRRQAARIGEEHGDKALWVACSHGDVIKAAVADALGLHLDSFQRIVIDPCSVSVISYTPTRPFVVRVNDTGGDLSSLVPKPESESGKGSEDGDEETPPAGDAVPEEATVGGSTGVA
ncbi:putative phosphomutase (TIGR03848 family) [Actinomycetospora succinea]|uniref:Putative phosphomutase (TIGR03848 family) n=1 Tax=Actinomycetospora succinea TaxID=663603 RepID=A0A4R6UWH3_9PSEU|nr:histidine phosphatase family protein [Actinomycetospora succinea]TDQ51758.1 putative phosphomutase (TIGR03848 family) [Actinomycetospora succinea]